MNEPLPGAVSLSTSEEIDEKEAPTPVGSVVAPPAAEPRVEDELWDDSDGDGDGDDDEQEGERSAEARARAEPTVPIRFADVVSGQFDAEIESADVAAPKRVLSPQAETPKLHKVLAQAGLGSRLEMEQLIMEGRISVNNEPAHIGQRIQFGDQIKVNGRPIRYGYLQRSWPLASRWSGCTPHASRC